MDVPGRPDESQHCWMSNYRNMRHWKVLFRTVQFDVALFDNKYKCWKGRSLQFLTVLISGKQLKEGAWKHQESQLVIYTECSICEQYVHCVQKCAHGQKSLGDIEGTPRNWGMIRKYLIEASPCSYGKTLLFFHFKEWL